MVYLSYIRTDRDRGLGPVPRLGTDRDRGPGPQPEAGTNWDHQAGSQQTSGHRGLGWLPFLSTVVLNPAPCVALWAQHIVHSP